MIVRKIRHALAAIAPAQAGITASGLHPSYPAEIQPLRRHHLQQAEIQETQPDRTLLQQAQAVPAHRNALRPQPVELPSHGKDCLRPTLAQVL
jgi:hypothetical protein